MKAFECINPDGNYQVTVAVQDFRIPLWEKAFAVETLDGLFDMTPAETAIATIDAAIERFNTSPDALRLFVSKDDPIGLFGNRKALQQMRRQLAEHGGTITGLVDEETST